MRLLTGGFCILCLIFLFIPFFSKGQVVFGEYSEEERALEIVPFEPEAKQVTLYEEANAYFKVNGIFTDHFYRVKVLGDNVEGYGDFRILFYKGSNLTEDITRLQAQVSYLDGTERKIVKLSNKIHIKEVDLGDGYFELRIVFPHVKKGSILEYSYTKMDRSISLLDGWGFQKDIPALVSKYTFKAPDYFQYQMITQGKILQEVAQISEKNNTFSWTVKDIHSLPQEPFIGNISDYQVRVDGYLFTNEYVKTEDLETSDIFYASWNQMGTKLMKGIEMSSYLGDKIPKAKYPAEIFKDSTQKSTAVKIFDYVSKNYKAYSSRWLEPIYTLPDYLIKKEGNNFDKNLLLSHLLKLEGIDSHLIMVNEPAIGRGVLIEKPYINQFHSSILLAKTDGKQVFLDVSDSVTPFGLIPLRKLVPRGFFMEKNNGRLDDINVQHRSGTIHLVTLDKDSAQNLQLLHTLRFIDYDAMKVANILNSNAYKKSLEEMGIEGELYEFEFEDRVRENRIVTIRFKTNIKGASEEFIVINPFELSSFAHNPFTQTSRILPIAFDYPVFESFNVSLTIPDGYVLEDYPENQVITIPSKGVKFTFQADATPSGLKINTKVELLKSSFPALEYSDLKFIMESIASKMTEPILFKKL